MPWQETQSVDQREQFIDDVQRGRMPVLQLCAHYGVSRKTGYKWIARARHAHPGGGRIHTTVPNDLWTTDFKAEFRTGDGTWCYPLTLADQHTRYLVACHARPSTQTVTAWPIFEWVFRDYGLPRAIRNDNGAPFATVGLHGLSRLSVWWLTLGIAHQRITPGTPSENAAHERMHRSLKRRAIRPAQPTVHAQQRAFDRFREEYNDIRPHEALGMETPASRYAPSPRAYPTRIVEVAYSTDCPRETPPLTLHIPRTPDESTRV